jgi:hypothetical protein
MNLAPVGAPTLAGAFLCPVPTAILLDAPTATAGTSGRTSAVSACGTVDKREIPEDQGTSAARAEI